MSKTPEGAEAAPPRNRLLLDAGLDAGVCSPRWRFSSAPRALAFFLCESAVAIIVLELFNYIAHYGLTRRRDAAGRLEALSDHHSWNSSNVLANSLIFNMGRHSHHHRQPAVSYQRLAMRDAPELPFGYAGSILLALAPPLWRRVMDPKAAGVAHAMSSFKLWLGFLAMCVGVFMAILDIQVVASALTTIGAALNIAPEKLGWVQTGYLMAEVIAIPLTGLLTRALSLRWMFVMAILGFTLASLGCAFSSTIDMLIVLRVVQGFFGGMLIPAVFTSIFVMMPENRHILATTLAGLFAVIAPTIGPFVGGYLTTNYSWHWIFLVNVGPGLLVALLVGPCVRVGDSRSACPEKDRLRHLRAGGDFPGHPGIAAQ